ncbi:thiamine phosphate synthase [Virgibacillus ndiopensis]|uniref:thiamine phosphate synthase n=1 Tax=Virgibacillus ndiopensis TaxID=2004408 RepID=UPI000C06C425|nr:thiamine phosphate synthase [Virgibacillus ndiopensis]
MINKEDLQLYFIMGSNNTEKNLVQVLQQAINGGITLFQFREKGLAAKTDGEKRDLGLKLRDVCKENNIPFIVNDDTDLAIALKADGVHIGQNDESILEVKKRIPEHFCVGVSVSTVEEAILAENQGADYLGVGPIFATTTKKDALDPIGTQGLRAIKEKVTIPIVAIGGISNKNAREIMKAGAAGIAVISAICQVKNSQTAALELKKATNL